MKTYFKKVAFVAAIVMACGACFINSQKSEILSEVALANVEALASAINDGDIYCPYKGYCCVIKYTNGTSVPYWDKSPNYHPEN